MIFSLTRTQENCISVKNGYLCDMELDKMIKVVRELLEDTDIPMKDYHTDVIKDNGRHWLNVHRKDTQPVLESMKSISKILNKHADDWSVKIENGVLCFIIE